MCHKEMRNIINRDKKDAQRKVEEESHMQAKNPSDVVVELKKIWDRGGVESIDNDSSSGNPQERLSMSKTDIIMD